MMIISPIVVPSLRLKNMASTSVPSITAPPLIANPIPAPRKNPPNKATNKLSLVTLGKVTVATTNANPIMAKVVLIAKAFPMILYPKMIKGIQEAVSIPVMAKARIGHFVEAQILEALR